MKNGDISVYYLSAGGVMEAAETMGSTGEEKLLEGVKMVFDVGKQGVNVAATGGSEEVGVGCVNRRW